MTDEECNEVFRELQIHLSQNRLGWIVNLVNAEIDEGIVEVRSASAELDYEAGDMQRESSQARRKNNKKGIARRDLTAKEKLLALIEAIDVCIVEEENIRREIGNSLSRRGMLSDLGLSQDTTVRGVVFADSNGTLRNVSLPTSSSSELYSVLKNALEQLKKEIA